MDSRGGAPPGEREGPQEAGAPSASSQPQKVTQDSCPEALSATRRRHAAGGLSHTQCLSHPAGESCPAPPPKSKSLTPSEPSPPRAPPREVRPLLGLQRPRAPAQKPCHCGLTGATVFTVPSPPGWSPFPPPLPTLQQLKGAARVSLARPGRHPSARRCVSLTLCPWRGPGAIPQRGAACPSRSAGRWTPSTEPVTRRPQPRPRWQRPGHRDGFQEPGQVPGARALATGPRGQVHTWWSKPPSWPSTLSSYEQAGLCRKAVAVGPTKRRELGCRVGSK